MKFMPRSATRRAGPFCHARETVSVYSTVGEKVGGVDGRANEPSVPEVRRAHAGKRIWLAVSQLRNQPVTNEPYYTSTTCPQCGARVDGLRDRYACGICGWVSPPDDAPPTELDEE